MPAASGTPPPDRRTAGPFGALRHRNFRLFFGGQLVSLIGTWMHQVARSWLVLELTNSAFYVGVVAALGSLPVLLFSLYAGALADRMSKLKLILMTQTGAMILSFALAALVFTHTVSVWHIVVIAALIGVVNAFDVPGRQSFFIELVGRDDLMNAIALNSSSFNVTRILGPTAAGLLIGLVGVGACFLLDGFSFMAVIAALLLVRIPPFQRPTTRPSAWAHIGEGLRYVTSDRRIMALVVNIAVFSIFGYPFLVLLPVVAKQVLGKGAIAFGWMSSAVGAGALTGALLLAAFSRQLPKGRVLRWSSAIFGLVLAAFATARTLPLALLVLVGLGFVMITNNATTNTLLQTLAPDHMRGRVMSVYTLAFVGMGPIGALQAGYFAERFGAPAALTGGAAVCLACSLVLFWRVPELRELA
jgi:MFS family permease